MPTLSEYRFTGIDVSEWQGAIDWGKVSAAGIKFAIIRVADGTYMDARAVEYVKGARKYGIHVGLYMFSRANSVEKAKAEAARIVAFAQEHCPDLELPLFFDYEVAPATVTAAEVQAWALAFCEVVETAGFKAGIYYNWDYSVRFYPSGWFAAHPSLFRWYVYLSAASGFDDYIHFWQYSWTGRVDGIAADVDMCRSLYDPTEQEPEPDPEPEPEPEPDPEPEPEPAPRPEGAPTRAGIEYVEIRDGNTDVLGIIDTAQSIIWHSKYYSVGEFEIYTKASADVVAVLQIGNYVTRPDDVEVGIIERIVIEDDAQNGTMVTASGRFAKSLLSRRLIYQLSGNTNTPTILRGNVEEQIRKVVFDNAIKCAADSSRDIPILELDALSNIKLQFVDENGQPASKQVSCENLQTYTDAVLQEYGLGATVILDVGERKLRYKVFNGTNRSVDNTAGNDPVIFSKEFDNLTASNYEYDAATERNVALIGGAGEGAERYFTLLAGKQAGLQRRELFVDASSLQRTYKDESDVEQTYSDAEYAAMLNAAGGQQLAATRAHETFDGTMDITNSSYLYKQDFELGDIITQENADIGKYINVRVVEILEAQDENGYSVEAICQT